MITLVGAGPGRLSAMTLEAIEAIKNAQVVLAFKRVAESIKDIRDDVLILTRLDDILNLTKTYTDITIVVSGDPLFYGLGGTLKSRGIKIDKIIPGISSMQYASAKLQIPWQEMAFFSFHGREKSLEDLLKVKKACILLDKNYTAGDLSKDLKCAGATGTLHGISYLSYEEEEIITVSIGEAVSGSADLALAVIELE